MLAFDPGLHRLYVASESGGVSVYDVARGSLLRAAQSFMHENAHVFAVDRRTHRVYFPLQNAGGATDAAGDGTEVSRPSLEDAIKTRLRISRAAPS